MYHNDVGSVMVKALDCEIVVREFELQSRYYSHFRTNTLGKGMNPLILFAQSTGAVEYIDCFSAEG